MHWTMYVLPFESVYGVFGGAGQRLVPAGVVGVVEEGTTGAVVVPGGIGVVGTTDDGPTDGGPTDGGPTGVDSTGDDSTGDDSTGPVGPTGAVDPTGVVSTGDDSTGAVGPTGAVDLTGVVGAPGVVDAIGEVGPTEVSGSRGLVVGLVPVLVSTTTEPSEFVVVSAVVKVTGMVD